MLARGSATEFIGCIRGHCNLLILFTWTIYRLRLCVCVYLHRTPVMIPCHASYRWLGHLYWGSRSPANSCIRSQKEESALKNRSGKDQVCCGLAFPYIASCHFNFPGHVHTNTQHGNGVDEMMACAALPAVESLFFRRHTQSSVGQDSLSVERGRLNAGSRLHSSGAEKAS